jgi:hypothetical protein
MEHVLLLDVVSLALKVRSDAVEVKVVAAIVESRSLAVDIAPVSADLRLLIERRAVGTQETEVLYLTRKSN